MDELFLLMCKNQSKWAEEVKKQNDEKKEIKRIINRKYKSRGNRATDDIKKDLQNFGEGELIENPANGNWEFHLKEERYILK